MDDVAVHRSGLGFDETLRSLHDGIIARGATVFACIDQRAAAASAGLELRPTTLLIFGNPRAGTPLMNEFPLCALDLPLKILIWQELDRVFVAYTPARLIAHRYAAERSEDSFAAFDRLLSDLVESVRDRA